MATNPSEISLERSKALYHKICRQERTIPIFQGIGGSIDSWLGQLGCSLSFQ